MTVGECLSLPRQFKWGPHKVTALEALLRELVVVPIDSRSVLDRFAEFHSWTKSIGRTIGHNDLWIAANRRGDGRASRHDRRRLRPAAPAAHPQDDHL